MLDGRGEKKARLPTIPGSTSCSLDVPQETNKMEGRERWCSLWVGVTVEKEEGDSTLVVLSLNEVLELNWLRKWLMCIMELSAALHKGVC